jgi:peroxin-3
MIQGTRRWLRRNRTNFAIGAGVLGATYVAGQYVLGKLSEARQRMSDERVAKENLRRRFEQNQEDCTFTVLAILPTATQNILNAVPVEQVLEELQRQKAERLARSVGPSEIGTSAPPSVADTGEDDGGSSSVQTDSFIHASQVAVEGENSKEESIDAGGEKKAKKSKAQLWSEMKIGCTLICSSYNTPANSPSNNSLLYSHLHPLPPDPPHTHPAEPARPPQLPRLRRLARGAPTRQRRLAHQPREQ